MRECPGNRTSTVSEEVIDHELVELKKLLHEILKNRNKYHYPALDIWYEVMGNVLLSDLIKDYGEEEAKKLFKFAGPIVLGHLAVGFWTGYRVSKRGFTPSECRCGYVGF